MVHRVQRSSPSMRAWLSPMERGCSISKVLFCVKERCGVKRPVCVCLFVHDVVAVVAFSLIFHMNSMQVLKTVVKDGTVQVLLHRDDRNET